MLLAYSNGSCSETVRAVIRAASTKGLYNLTHGSVTGMPNGRHIVVLFCILLLASCVG